MHREAHGEEHAVEPEEMTTLPTRKITLPEPRQRDLRGDALDLADVGVDARRDLPDRHLGEETRRQPLQLAEYAEPHLEQDFGRRPRVHETAHDVEREAAERERRELQNDADERGVSRPSKARSIRQPREIRDVERGQRADERQQQHEARQPPPTAARLAKRAAQVLVQQRAHVISLRDALRGTMITFVMSAPRFTGPSARSPATRTGRSCCPPS